jgi:recombination protein RecA
MSKALRKFVPVVSETNTLLIFVNQIRSKIGTYGDPMTTTGGFALDFYATGRIAVKGGEYKTSWIKDKITDEVIGHKTDFHVKKNKLAPPFRNAQVPLIYGIGYDSHWETLILAENLGIIEKSGAWYKRNGDNIAQGEENAIDYLKENIDVYNEIRNEVIDLMGLKELYERNS